MAVQTECEIPVYIRNSEHQIPVHDDSASSEGSVKKRHKKELEKQRFLFEGQEPTTQNAIRMAQHAQKHIADIEQKAVGMTYFGDAGQLALGLQQRTYHLEEISAKDKESKFSLEQLQKMTRTL